jgi:hypothetical protein
MKSPRFPARTIRFLASVFVFGLHDKDLPIQSISMAGVDVVDHTHGPLRSNTGRSKSGSRFPPHRGG